MPRGVRRKRKVSQPRPVGHEEWIASLSLRVVAAGRVVVTEGAKYARIGTQGGHDAAVVVAEFYGLDALDRAKMFMAAANCEGDTDDDE